MGVAAMLKNNWQDADFAFASLSDRNPVSEDDDLIVLAAPDPQGAQHLSCIALRFGFPSGTSIICCVCEYDHSSLLVCRPALCPQKLHPPVFSGQGAKQATSGSSLQPANVCADCLSICWHMLCCKTHMASEQCPCIEHLHGSLTPFKLFCRFPCRA